MVLINASTSLLNVGRETYWFMDLGILGKKEGGKEDRRNGAREGERKKGGREGNSESQNVWEVCQQKEGGGGGIKTPNQMKGL